MSPRNGWVAYSLAQCEPRLSRWVWSFGPFLHENLRRVFPRVWRTLFVHMAMAAPSFAEGPLPIFGLTYLRTLFIQLQNLPACDLRV